MAFWRVYTAYISYDHRYSGRRGDSYASQYWNWCCWESSQLSSRAALRCWIFELSSNLHLMPRSGFHDEARPLIHIPREFSNRFCDVYSSYFLRLYSHFPRIESLVPWLTPIHGDVIMSVDGQDSWKASSECSRYSICWVVSLNFVASYNNWSRIINIFTRCY